MNIEAVLRELVGDISRFGTRADRVEGLVESQRSRYRPNSSDWLVLPWSDGFYLFSEDTEGQRRGRESLVAFLGPGVVSVETVPAVRLQRELPEGWKQSGLVCASYLDRVVPGQAGADEMLARLEDLVATIGGRVWRQLELKPTRTDLLRDFRLALLSRDDESASRLFEGLRLNGQVSAENLRYLRIEYLAAFGRWADLRALPYVDALLKSRRPRAISEILLQMVWWAELAGAGHQHILAAFKERGVLETFGQLLRALRVPCSREGRLVGFLTALADGDVERQQAILDQAQDADESAHLRALGSESSTARTADGPEETLSEDPVAAAFTAGRFGDVVTRFVTNPSVEHSDLAVQAVLESEINDDASQVLVLVREFDARGELDLSRRARRDLEELGRLTAEICDGWVVWSKRLAGEARWADASNVARNRSGSWKRLGEYDAGEIDEVCDSLIEAAGGTNDDQLRSSLDILCNEAAAQLLRGFANDFCQTVLMLLAEQDNFSEMVRAAYLDLLAAWLGVGPPGVEYRKVLEQTTDIWNAIASPNAMNWAIGVLEAAADSSCPDEGARTTFAVGMIERARRLYARAGLRERVEIEGLATDLGLESQRIEASEVERNAWSELDGKLLGLYSLLPRAAATLGNRLVSLSSVEVKGNDDKVATPGLRALAERSDYFIVDTWHAAHQATAAIDAVRPRHRQILPQQRGVTGFLRALETCLAR
jgi:hypothetical protein